MIKVLPLLLLAACQDYSLEKVESDGGGGPDIEVTPTTVLFPNLSAGESATGTFSISNVGDTTLTIDNVMISDGDMFTITDTSRTAGRLAPDDEAIEIVVEWVSTGGEDIGQAVVLSDDPVDAEVYVELLTGQALPDLVIDPDSVDFGAVPVGDSRDATVTLRNEGEGTLTITDIGESPSVFSHTANFDLPLELASGEEKDITVTFTPDDSDIWNGELSVTSNDPEGVEIAPLQGEAGSQPIADCAVDPETVMAIWEDATWVGDGSYDPQGYAITKWDWTLVSQPSGSSVTMPGSITDANRSRFTPDMVGEYVAELVVTNEIGDRSEPCTATLTAEPGGDMWVEMYWTEADDDMDLHLLAPGGSLRGDKDCYYANTNPDWGVRGDSDDDPALDLDDIPGTGPENINIKDPENGTFKVYVNDYTGSTPDYRGANSVTVNVYIGGILEWTDTRDISGESADEAFCEIEMPSGTVTSL